MSLVPYYAWSYRFSLRSPMNLIVIIWLGLKFSKFKSTMTENGQIKVKVLNPHLT